MICILVTVFAGLVGLASGSFLNTCASRWPEDEKVTTPRSHCRSCGRTLTWWENVPLVSWMALRGRCRTCRAWIGWRYPLAELAIGVLWAYCAWQVFIAAPELNSGIFSFNVWAALTEAIARMIFLWLLVALAVLDAEFLWLPDRLTLPGIGLGLLLAVTRATLDAFWNLHGGFEVWEHVLPSTVVLFWFLGAVLGGGVLLAIRFAYRVIRDQEGIGFGDVKLMAMIGGWIGLKGALLSFVLAVVLGAVVSLALRGPASTHASSEKWHLRKVPFGTFLCIGGIVSGLWGKFIIAAYLRWSGFL
jgi:leader peptidase (prepilin peptidase)/N-methyltransferase